MIRRLSVLKVFFTTGILLVAGLFLVFWAGTRALQSHRNVQEQINILSSLEECLSTLKDAETGQRGFLLTGDEPYLAPYVDAVARIQTNRLALQQFALSEKLPATDVEKIRRLIDVKLGELDQTIQVRRARGFEPALAIARAGAGKATMDEIRATVKEMEVGQRTDLAKALRDADAAIHLRTITFFLSGILNLAFLAWAASRIRNEILNRDSALLEISRQKDLFATTLASIGDGVIVTDRQGCITFLNREAERLTGWENADASGQPLPSVFRIINESTRQPVPNPVDKVLLSGGTVGLANHTLLIAKNGTETAIDDSAAPIRPPGGELAGVVLVFRDFTEHKLAQESIRAARDALILANSSLEATVENRTVELREMIGELQQVAPRPRADKL